MLFVVAEFLLLLTDVWGSLWLNIARPITCYLKYYVTVISVDCNEDTTRNGWRLQLHCHLTLPIPSVVLRSNHKVYYAPAFQYQISAKSYNPEAAMAFLAAQGPNGGFKNL